jgi:hypothetical protein
MKNATLKLIVVATLMLGTMSAFADAPVPFPNPPQTASLNN